MRDETLLILAGGALLVGVIVHHKLTAQADDEAGGDLPLAPGAGLPVYPPYVPGAPPVTVTPPPSSTSSPPPAVTPPTPAQVNAAFAAQEAAAHANQDQYYADQVAELKARVASGAVQIGSPYYLSTMAYLANLQGGVATADAEMAKLHAQGLAGRPRGPRLAWSRRDPA